MDGLLSVVVILMYTNPKEREKEKKSVWISCFEHAIGNSNISVRHAHEIEMWLCLFVRVPLSAQHTMWLYNITFIILNGVISWHVPHLKIYVITHLEFDCSEAFLLLYSSLSCVEQFLCESINAFLTFSISSIHWAFNWRWKRNLLWMHMNYGLFNHF